MPTRASADTLASDRAKLPVWRYIIAILVCVGVVAWLLWVFRLPTIVTIVLFLAANFILLTRARPDIGVPKNVGVAAEKAGMMIWAAFLVLVSITLGVCAVNLRLAGNISALLALAAFLIGAYYSKASRDPHIEWSLSLWEEVFGTQLIYLSLGMALVSACIWMIVALKGGYGIGGPSPPAPGWLWSLYVLGILMAWYQNSTIACGRMDRPRVLSGVPEFVFTAIRLAVGYGTLILLWRISGVKTALMAFGAYYVFNLTTIRFYYHQELLRQIDFFVQFEREKARRENLLFDEWAICKDALQGARLLIAQNMKG